MGQENEGTEPKIPIERVQTGFRLEKRMVKVLRATADYLDKSPGELLEEIILHAFEGGEAFTPEMREKVQELKRFFGMDYDVKSKPRFAESPATLPPGRRRE